MNFLELFFRSGQVTGLGMLAVFAIIAIIFVVIKALGVTVGSDKKPAAKAKAKAEAETKKEPDPEPDPAAPAAASDDLALIAVLAAAISAYTGEPVTKFRVVSFKHIK